MFDGIYFITGKGEDDINILFKIKSKEISPVKNTTLRRTHAEKT